MSHIDRRAFLEGSIALAGAAALTNCAKAAPNDTVGVAVLGSGRGASLANWFARLPESQIVAVCEIDES